MMKKPEKKEFKHPHCQWGTCQECWGIEQYNIAISEYDNYLIHKLEQILYQGMPKPTNFEECSGYFEREIKKLLEEVKSL